MSETQAKEASVLIIEDDHDLADLYADWLSDKYNTTTAYDSEAALDHLHESVDVVLLDRRLPGLSGDEVLERIREQKLDIRVAIVSAVTPDFAVIGLGIDDYLVKPVEKDEIRDLVDRMVKRTTYDETVQKLKQLKSSKETLEEELSDDKLQKHEEYDELLDQIDELEAKAAATAEDIDEEFEG